MDMSNHPSESVLAPERLGQAAFVLMVPVFAYLGYVLFDDLLFGGLIGLLVGSGTFLYLPYFIYREAVQQGNATDVDGDHTRRAAVGIGLASGGMVAIAMRFVFEGAYVLPFAVAIIYTLVIYVPLDYALPSVDTAER
ncbi:hypothetical protein [Natronomonas halophila]|uniref:hypothetical protein n=1 Tax=Natronomonas halophila TaxID=2747817 RepID=UPI001BABCF11|nr:hypothetical protein [Natronomonas halophila]